MLTDKQKQEAIDFVEKLNGEYHDKEFHDDIKKEFDSAQEFKNKLIKFLGKNERKYNLPIIYIALKSLVETMEEQKPIFKDVNKEANQIAKLHKEEKEENEMDNKTK